jgi:hypothetical protein
MAGSLIKKILKYSGAVLGKHPVHSNPSINQGCTEFEVNNWVVSDFLVRNLVPVVGIHPYPINELFLMAAAVCRLRPTHIVEWGTNTGVSARIFFEVSKAFGIDVEIHSIDLPDDEKHVEHPGARRGVLVRNIPAVRLYQGDGLTEGLRICKNANGRVQPLFFLDGDHEYESVVRELKGIITEFPQAAILVHDTFYQSSDSGYNIGPFNAIVDVLSSTSRPYFRLATDTGLPGMTFLWPKDYT